MKFFLQLVLCFVLLSTVSCSSNKSELNKIICSTMFKKAKIDNVDEPRLICKQASQDIINEQIPSKTPMQSFTQFETYGFPPGNYEFFAVKFDKSKVSIGKGYIDEQGEFQLDKMFRTLPLSRFISCGSGFLPGEPIHYVLISEDRTCVASDFIVPNPIEARWFDGAQISMIAIDPSMECFILEGNGFKSNEVLQVVAKSCNEILSYDSIASSDGEVFLMAASGMQSKICGKGTYTIKRKNGEIKTLSYFQSSKVWNR